MFKKRKRTYVAEVMMFVTFTRIEKSGERRPLMDRTAGRPDYISDQLPDLTDYEICVEYRSMWVFSTLNT